MIKIMLLILIILNLIWISILAFLGKKNLLLIFSIIEVILAVIFPIISFD